MPASPKSIAWRIGGPLSPVSLRMSSSMANRFSLPSSSRPNLFSGD
jgi:hypothetical protein